MSSSLQDPILHLPKECFLNVIALLSKEDVAWVSSTNRTWKKTIESDPTLFTEVEVKEFPNQQGVSHRDKMSKGCSHLLRFIKLSSFRLRKIHWDWRLFVSLGVKVLPSISDQDGAPAQFFKGLSLARSSTLKNISFILPSVSLRESSELSKTVAEQVIELIKVIESDFPIVNDVTIQASTHINLVSRSPSKRISVLHHWSSSYQRDKVKKTDGKEDSTSVDGSHQEPSISDEDEEEDESQEDWRAYLSPAEDEKIFPKDRQLIRQMQRFSGTGITEMRGERGRAYSEKTLHQLMRSHDSIEEIRFNLEHIIDSQHWFYDLVLAFPNLKRLQITDGPDSIGNVFPINIPDFLDPISKLTELNMYCEFSSHLRWNDRFTKWIGNKLESLDLAYQSGFQRYPIDFKALVMFLKANSSTLWHIRIVGMGIDPVELRQAVETETLVFPRLLQLNLQTNPETIQLFTGFDMPTLRSLELRVAREDKDRALPHNEILKLLKSTSRTLWEFNLHNGSGKDLSSNERSTKSTFQEILTFDTLVALSLNMNAEDLSIYSRLKYPKLKAWKLDLPHDLSHLEDQFLPQEELRN